MRHLLFFRLTHFHIESCLCAVFAVFLLSVNGAASIKLMNWKIKHIKMNVINKVKRKTNKSPERKKTKSQLIIIMDISVFHLQFYNPEIQFQLFLFFFFHFFTFYFYKHKLILLYILFSSPYGQMCVCVCLFIFFIQLIFENNNK